MAGSITQIMATLFREFGECCNLPSGVWGRAPAEIEFGAF